MSKVFIYYDEGPQIQLHDLEPMIIDRFLHIWNHHNERLQPFDGLFVPFHIVVNTIGQYCIAFGRQQFTKVAIEH